MTDFDEYVVTDPKEAEKLLTATTLDIIACDFRDGDAFFLPAHGNTHSVFYIRMWKDEDPTEMEDTVLKIPAEVFGDKSDRRALAQRIREGMVEMGAVVKDYTS